MPIEVTGKSETHTIENDYILVTAGTCRRVGVQMYPKTGTHVITVKNVGGRR